MLSRTLCSALLLGVVLGAAAACGDESPAAGAGGLDVLEGSDARAVTGTDFPLLVPNGSYVFTVAEPRTDLPEDAADPAVDGSRTTYVGIAWRPEGNAPEFGPVLHGTAPLPAPVRVVQGDETAAVTELGADTVGGNANGVVWVAVDEGGPDPVLEVEYDGLVQTFDLATGEREPGPADGFYDDTGTARASCEGDEPADTRDRLDVRCQVTDVAAVPYVAELGWAEEGRTWLVFGVLLSPGDHEILGQEGTVSSGGEVAVVLSEDTPSGNGWSASLAVPVDNAAPVTLEVERTYELGPDRTSVTYTASISLPPSA